MASTVIHMVVSKLVNKKLKRNENVLLMGSIAPDISKCIGDTKEKSHFLDNEIDNIPNMNKFLEKYKDYLNDDFVMGYYIHLYTDYLWFKYYLPSLENNNIVTKLNGEKVKLNGNMLSLYIYNDYTNLNIELLTKYNIDLEFLYNNELFSIPNIIEEIPMDKLNILFDKTIDIVSKSKLSKSYLFDMESIDKFIKMATNEILKS